MVPGAYSPLRTGTISGRAWAALVASKAAPTVTAKAATIRFDIERFSTSPRAAWTIQSRAANSLKLAKGAAGPRIFNRTRWPTGFHGFAGRRSSRARRGKVRIKVNDLETTLAGKPPQFPTYA